jgi:hypothetical protein
METAPQFRSSILSITATLLVCALAPSPALASSSSWHHVQNRDGELRWADDGRWRAGQHHGTLSFRPDAMTITDDAIVGLSGRSGATDGAVVAILALDGTPRATLSLRDLVGEEAADGFWRPGVGEVAWRVDHWIAGGRLIVVPDAPGQPVAVSLADGLVENPQPGVFVQRLLQGDLWFGRRLRALELAAAGPRTATLDRALRRVVVEQSAPLVLRLRAAALLADVGDPTGRSLVLLTARSPAASAGLRRGEPHQLVLPVPSEPCEQPPGAALHLPYDEDAARSYAIRLLPALLGVDSVPLLRPLLGSGDDQDRRDAALALGCLAQEHPEIGHRLAERPPTPRRARPRGLASVGSQGAGDAMRRLAMALIPMMLLGALARRR